MVLLAEDFVTVKRLREDLPNTLERIAEGKSVVVTRDGLPAAVMVSPEEYDDIQALRRQLIEYHVMLAEAAQERVERGEAMTTAEFRTKIASLTGSAIDETADLSQYIEPY